MSQIYARIAVEPATGLRFQYESKQGWGKTYHSFDGARTWNASKRIAFSTAKNAGQLQPEGMIRITQDGQPDTFRSRVVVESV